ncbi:MAG: hypothetical protein JST32_14160 [Bacteroidetes bacterium]|nr:hypothetical protein [Bacteroidota bacterium]
MENSQPNLNQSLARLGAIFTIAWAIGQLFGERKDTINYVLFHKGKKVYHGICLEHRLDARLAEHERDGKVFDDYHYGQPKTNMEACRIEQARIFRDQTKYNIHHR